MKIAIVFEGDVYNPRGEFIAIHNRIKTLKKMGINIDAFVLWPHYGKISNILIGDKNGILVKNYSLDAIGYHCIWYDKSILDTFTHKLFKKSTSIEVSRIYNLIDLSNYDIVSAHSLKSARIALDNYKKNDIPFVVTWHGSSIHSLPFLDKNWYSQTEEILKCTFHNFYVSKELQDIANSIALNKGSVSLNGIDTERFYPYTNEIIRRVKQNLSINQTGKNVAFIGNCYPIKNVTYLPYLFNRIKNELSDVNFFIVGDIDAFKKIFKNVDLTINYLGSLSNEQMPLYYNVFDLVVLPSLKEGLPMTALESIACGAYFVGSKVGEIPNVVGDYFSILRDENFDNSFADRCIQVLKESPKQISLDMKYSVHNIVSSELSIMRRIVNKCKRPKTAY